MDIWYLAVCRPCEFKMPFRSEAERETWASAHRWSHVHTPIGEPILDAVTYETEIR